MMMSPRLSRGTSCSMVLCTGAPAGSITQTTRRGDSWRAMSATFSAFLTPLPTYAFTASAFWS